MLKIIAGPFFVILFCFSALAQENSKNTVIINNEAKAGSSIKAPVLIPSQATKLRQLRERQEIRTEDSILKELETRRLREEQRRLDSMISKEYTAQSPEPVKKLSDSLAGRFSNSSYISLGTGFMIYYNVTNINSTEVPALFFSFGAYQKPFIIDFSVFHSTHYLSAKNKNYNLKDFRERVNEPGLSISLKYALFRSAAKPYVGVTGSLIGRKWSIVKKDGTVLKSNPEVERLKRDVAKKQWHFSVNGGASVGADIALGKKLGFNMDLSYYVNLFTENRKSFVEELTDEQILDERDAVALSVKLKYLF